MFLYMLSTTKLLLWYNKKLYTNKSSYITHKSVDIVKIMFYMMSTSALLVAALPEAAYPASFACQYVKFEIFQFHKRLCVLYVYIYTSKYILWYTCLFFFVKPAYEFFFKSVWVQRYSGSKNGYFVFTCVAAGHVGEFIFTLSH